MYKLRIHTVDDSSNPFPTTSSAAPGPKPSTTNKNDDFSHITELKGVVHLFRCLSPAPASLTSPSSRSTTLFVADVTNYPSREEFLTFCGPHLDHFSQLCFLRNDGMEDRYSVLITLVNQLRSDGFYCSFNGNLFRPSEVNAGLECGIVTDDFYDETLLRLSRVWKRSGRLKRLQPRWQLQLKELSNDRMYFLICRHVFYLEQT